jgi:hypothetical protein
LVLLLKKAEVEAVVVDEPVGGRRGDRSSSLIGGRLDVFLWCFLLLYCI